MTRTGGRGRSGGRRTGDEIHLEIPGKEGRGSIPRALSQFLPDQSFPAFL